MSGNNGRKGRVQTSHFGYSAFGSGSGQATTDIGAAITNATFSGQTLAYAVTGQPQFEQYRGSKLLRGEATFTVSIPKTGNGTIDGDLKNFEEWTGNYWVHPIFFGLREARYRWLKSCIDPLLAVKCCSENNRGGDFLGERPRRATV